jgi:hypothetical protein
VTKRRADERAENRCSSQGKIGAAVVSPDLQVRAEDLFGGVKVADDELTVRAAGDDPPCVFFHCHALLTGTNGRPRRSEARVP